MYLLPSTTLLRGHRALPSLVAAAVLLGACAVGPDYVAEAPAVPAEWSQPIAAGDAPPTWREFADPTLDALVQDALAANLDLRAALLRLDAARAELGIATADRWPGLDANGSYAHRRESTNTPFGAFIPRTDIHSVSFDATWELDLWGRVRRSVEAADRGLQASAADMAAAQLSIVAEVARTYVDLRAAQRRLAIAEENLRLQQQTLELVAARLAAGLVGERDVAQAATSVETTRSRLPQLQAAARGAEHRLAVLVGKAPGSLRLEASGRVPTVPVTVAVGQPADLLRNRPDVRAAERRFAQAVARIGVAEADRYPRLALNGSLGLSADGPEQLFENDSRFVGFGPSLRWNLFDGGRLKHRVAALQAGAEAAQVGYEQTVLLALEEAENAITAFVFEQARRSTLQAAAAQARRAVDLARTQYQEGLSDFQAVLDSQRIAATIDDDLAVSEATIASNWLALWKALGGPERERDATATAAANGG